MALLDRFNNCRGSTSVFVAVFKLSTESINGAKSSSMIHLFKKNDQDMHLVFLKTYYEAC